MRKLSIREAREAMGRIDELLDEAGELLLTRRGKPIAKIVKVRRETRVPTHKELRSLMPPMARGSEELLREERDQS